MTDTVKLNLCILWEGELRKAAKLLATAQATPTGPEQNNAVVTAYAACLVALHGLTDDHIAVMVGDDAIRRVGK